MFSIYVFFFKIMFSLQGAKYTGLYVDSIDAECKVYVVVGFIFYQQQSGFIILK